MISKFITNCIPYGTDTMPIEIYIQNLYIQIYIKELHVIHIRKHGKRKLQQ